MRVPISPEFAAANDLPLFAKSGRSSFIGLWMDLKGSENVLHYGSKVVACDLSALGCRLALFRQTRGFGIMCGMKKIEKELEQVNVFVNRRWEQTVGFVNCQMLLTGWTVGAFVSARLKSSA